MCGDIPSPKLSSHRAVIVQSIISTLLSPNPPSTKPQSPKSAISVADIAQSYHHTELPSPKVPSPNGSVAEAANAHSCRRRRHIAQSCHLSSRHRPSRCCQSRHRPSRQRPKLRSPDRISRHRPDRTQAQYTCQQCTTVMRHTVLQRTGGTPAAGAHQSHSASQPQSLRSLRGSKHTRPAAFASSQMPQ